MHTDELLLWEGLSKQGSVLWEGLSVVIIVLCMKKVSKALDIGLLTITGTTSLHNPQAGWSSPIDLDQSSADKSHYGLRHLAKSLLSGANSDNFDECQYIGAMHVKQKTVSTIKLMPRIPSLLLKINNMKLPAKTALTAGIATAVIIILPYIVNLMFTVLPRFLAALASVVTPIFTAAGLAWLITYIWTKQWKNISLGKSEFKK